MLSELFCKVSNCQWLFFSVCRDNQYIDEGRKLCINCPENSLATQNYTATSVRDCYCDNGYQGDPGNGLICQGNVEVSIKSEFEWTPEFNGNFRSVD